MSVEDKHGLSWSWRRAFGLSADLAPDRELLADAETMMRSLYTVVQGIAQSEAAEGAPVPNETAMRNTVAAAMAMQRAGYERSTIRIADDGGFDLIYSIHGRRTKLIVDNDGEIVLLVRNADTRVPADTWLFTADDAGIREMIGVIGGHLYA